MTDPTRTTPATIVQTAATLPALDSGWTTQPWIDYMGDDEGAGQIIGSASFRQVYGHRTAFGGHTFSTVTAVSGLEGTLVRVLAADPLGTVTVAGAAYTPFWWGVITDSTNRPNLGGAGGTVELSAAGLGAVLDQICIRAGRVISGNSATVIDPSYCPPFNALPGGDRSASGFTVNGAASYVHDLTTVVGSGHWWTARQVLDLLLAMAARPDLPGLSPAGWTWQINDPDGCLDYTVHTMDLTGWTVHQALTALAGQRRGAAWYLSVSGATVSIVVHAIIASPITIGTFTLPATTLTTDVVLDGNAYIRDLAIGVDASSAYDRIELRGARPWVGLTVAYAHAGNPSLTDGWFAGFEPTWESDPEDSSTLDVWRRFAIDAQWNGENKLGTNGLRDLVDDDGTRTYSNGADTMLPGLALQCDRLLPATPDFGTDRVDAFQRPVVVMGKAGEGYVDMVQTFGWSIQVQSEPPAVVIDDRDNGRQLKALFDGGWDMFVTLGFREATPLLMAWQRAQADWPRAAPRVKLIELPHLEQWLTLADTVTGVDSSGALNQMPADQNYRDDIPIMQSLLATAVAWLSEPAPRASWTELALLDTGDTLRPGTLIRTITAGGATITVNGVITRRMRRATIIDGVPSWSTIYSIERVVPELEALL